MAKFITGNELVESLCDIIRSAKKQLLIVSPYIKLDEYFKKELFDTLKGNSSLHIIIAFGKNENNPLKSIKKEDIDYFKSFPNISIIYIPNLHAKYYANEKRGIITSINLYDYSFDNNVEYGVISENSILANNDIDYQAWNETIELLENNYSIFIRRPNYKKKFVVLKDYLGSETQLDLTNDLISGKLKEKISFSDFMPERLVNVNPSRKEALSRQEFNSQKLTQNLKNQKLLSATSLGKIKEKSYKNVLDVMKKKGYILDKDSITEKGLKHGISYKTNAKGAKWVVYPESLAEIL